MKRFDPLKPLVGDQRQASNPADLVWLSASAGTGKTQVLSARVLRLLLHGVRPEAILCLTFTKAGAAEMADRIHARLAHWVRLADKHLRKELYNLGEDNGDAAVARARTLFARVLDAPGGGLRIQTIHSFCQTLLAAFPAEAGLIPGFRPIEGREEAALARRTLADLLAEAERGGDLGLIRDIELLSRRLGEGKAEAYLIACARAPQALRALGSREGIEPRLRHALGVPLGDIEAAIAKACGEAFDCETLRAIAAANAAWATKSGLKRADVAAAWLAADGPGRADMLTQLHDIWTKADGDLRSFGKGHAPQDADYEAHCRRLHERCAALLAMRERAMRSPVRPPSARRGSSISTI
jgi:ATP-dependent helicase/nuclease subunit A